MNEQYLKYLASIQSPETQRSQGLVSAGAGIVDLLRGRGMQRGAEQEIEELGANVEDIQSRMDQLTAPSMMSDEVLAAATRNAAILGQQFQPDPSEELAAAKTAIEAGADPATVARMQAEAQTREQQQNQAQGQQAFQQGLQFGQQDAFNEYAQQQQALGTEMDLAQQQLEAAQRESLTGQQLAQAGTSNIGKGVGKFITNYDPTAAGEGAGFFQNLGTNIFQAEEGMKVQKTPGEFDHDTNDMILMAQTEGGLVDTGIRQTGGEFVLNPEQADGLEEAYENVTETTLHTISCWPCTRLLDSWTSHSLKTITQHNGKGKVLRPPQASVRPCKLLMRSISRSKSSTSSARQRAAMEFNLAKDRQKQLEKQQKETLGFDVADLSEIDKQTFGNKMDWVKSRINNYYYTGGNTAEFAEDINGLKTLHSTKNHADNVKTSRSNLEGWVTGTKQWTNNELELKDSMDTFNQKAMMWEMSGIDPDSIRIDANGDTYAYYTDINGNRLKGQDGKDLFGLASMPLPVGLKSSSSYGSTVRQPLAWKVLQGVRFSRHQTQERRGHQLRSEGAAAQQVGHGYGHAEPIGTGHGIERIQ